MNNEWTVDELVEKFGSTYDNGEPTYHVSDKVHRLCPCGLTQCKYHIIPTIMQFEGPMDYKGQDLSRLFMEEKVMTITKAREWWQQYGLVCITSTKIVRTVYVNWSEIASFPVGHELEGQVKQGTEEKKLREHFTTFYPCGTPKYRIEGMCVVQQCPCGKVECDTHVIPSTVELDSNVPLELHTKSKVIQFEKTFRGLDAMISTDVQDWFMGYPLKWDVEVSPKVVKLRMLCKCLKSFDVIPCQDCAFKETKACLECHERYQKRYIKKGLCGNCRRLKKIHCEHCNEMVPFAHECKPLTDMHFKLQLGGIHPPCIRQKGSKNVICPDCNKCMKYTIYHRHQYRVHSDLHRGTGGFTRDYKWHKCPYCNYKNCDITNVREHLKIHLSLRQHECRYGCGASFTRPSAENLHCRIVHGHQDASSSSLKRVGNELVSVPKKRKICYVG